jgi:hypothetical protein
MALSSYTPPNVYVSQTFLQTPTDSTPILNALVIGAQYDLFRYLVAAEKASTAVVNPTTPSLGNEYQYETDVTYAYPNQPVGTTVDTSFVALNIDNVLAQYLPNTGLSSNSGNAAAALVTAPSGSPYPNRLRFTNGSGTVAQTLNGFNRSSYLSNRDVQVGDVAVITDNLGNTLTTKVTGLVADTVAQNSGLASVVAPVLATATDGVTTSSSPIFTSVTAPFTAAMVNNFITINTIGAFKIVAYNSPSSITLSSSIASGATGLTYTVGGTYNDPANAAINTSVIGSPTYSGPGSAPGSLTIVAKSGTAYVGYNTQRILSDTYTVTCTTGGLLGAAVFTVSSAAGAFTPVTGVTISSGTLPIDNNGNNVVNFTVTGSGTFIVGNAWTLAVSATVAQVKPTGAGTYTGASNIVYTLTVVRGGPLLASNGSNASTAAILSVTSSNVDNSPNVQPIASTVFQVGTLGVTGAFAAGSNNGGFILGDKYYIPANAPLLGAVKSLVFADNLPAASIASASTFTVVLSEVQQGYLVNPIASVVDGTLNYAPTTTGITINSGITTSDPLLVAGGVPVALPITAGNLFVTYRALVPTNSTSVGTFTDSSQITAVVGTIDPANPIAQGCYYALLNSAGASVSYISVASNDLTGFNTALGILAGTSGASQGYSLVPMTFDPTVQEAVVAFADAQSSSTVGNWRIAWISIPNVSSKLLYNEQPNNSNWLATVAADPENPTTTYSLFSVVGASFVTDGVRPGDNVFINFISNPNGTVSYTSIPVAEVRTNSSLVTTVGLAGPISVGTKFQLQRNYTSSEQAANLGALIGAYNDRRVRVIVPDTAKSAGVVTPGYLIAAQVAGLASGVPANQGLTNATVLGCDDLSETLTNFNYANLNTLAENGAFILTQTAIGATPYIRQQLTTAEASGNLNSAEDSITRNVDSVSYQMKANLQPYVGKYNINSFTLRLMKDSLNALLITLQTLNQDTPAGPQLLPGSQVVSIAQDATFLDKVNIVVQLVVGYPLNIINLNLVVGQTVTVSATTA